MGNFKSEFISWKMKNNEHGPRAMTRFVMIKFIEGLDFVSPGKYIFKGGNLLWHYIKTPRPTVDIDFSTDIEIVLADVVDDIGNVSINELIFKVKSAEIIETDLKVGFAIQMEFFSAEGSRNSFGIDIVIANETHKKKIKLLGREVSGASMENIIVDKVHTCHRFKSGNTRMKDFDDLYRIALSGERIDKMTIREISKARNVKLLLDRNDISEAMEHSWRRYVSSRHYKGSKDLPRELREVVDFINKYLNGIA